MHNFRAPALSGFLNKKTQPTKQKTPHNYELHTELIYDCKTAGRDIKLCYIY